MNKSDTNRIRKHLQDQYLNVFSNAHIEVFIDNYVNFAEKNILFNLLGKHVKKHDKLLDIGCGYGAFVEACRKKHIEAYGLDTAKYEIEFARKRIKTKGNVFFMGDAQHLPFKANTFDAVTMWNLLEHVPDPKKVISEAYRVLNPGGDIFLICPNYLAFRKEAHYHVPWFPLLPKFLAVKYLKTLGRNPEFLANDIFYTTNSNILEYLRASGFKIIINQTDLGARLKDPSPIESPTIRNFVTFLYKNKLVFFVNYFEAMYNLYQRLEVINPFKPNIVIHAVK